MSATADSNDMDNDLSNDMDTDSSPSDLELSNDIIKSK